MSKYGPYKRGDRHPDGRIFYCYHHGKEMWCDPERYERKLKTAQNYDKACKEYYGKKEHPPMFFYDIIRKQYYVGRSGTKERWVNYDEFVKIRKARDLKDKKFREKRRLVKKIAYKRGQQHPDNPELFFVAYNSGKALWMNAEEYSKSMTARRESSGQCTRKGRIRKQNILKKIKNKYRRGEKKDGKVFWDYTTYGIEVWLEPEVFQKRHQAILDKAKRYRERLKLRKVGDEQTSLDG